ncbi:hypothetical protein HMPREF9555_01616 [Selenomonas artemidis F0399]|jgi:hypothetical protein|uniref:Uncharacterized protein n=1 Tax=Selenomonas artemidis F0399 TaxID=749551 RepID=E7N3M6_9FIRM|nr:hypothetical protein HMPREF9555_01616 [Selenomonas artemidis F0399]
MHRHAQRIIVDNFGAAGMPEAPFFIGKIDIAISFFQNFSVDKSV